MIDRWTTKMPALIPSVCFPALNGERALPDAEGIFVLYVDHAAKVRELATLAEHFATTESGVCRACHYISLPTTKAHSRDCRIAAALADAGRA